MNKKELQSIVKNLKGYKLILTKEEYKKEGRKNFPKNPSKVTTEEITTKEYDYIFSSINFFKSLVGSQRVYKSYTIAGYIPTRLINTSPNKDTKIVRIITIER